MLICIDPDETWDYVVKGDGDQEAVFTLGVIPEGIYREITRKNGPVNDNGHSLSIELCRYGVKGHRGLAFKKGDQIVEVPFATEKDEKGRTVVSQKTLEVYYASGFFAFLGLKILTRGKVQLEKSPD